MSGRIDENRLAIYQDALDYFTNLVNVTADILRGETVTKACSDHDVSMSAYRNLIGNEKLGYKNKHLRLSGNLLGFNKELLLSWQEILWLDIFAEKDPRNIPPDVDESVDAALKDPYITGRERTVIFMRYKEQMTLEEVSKHFGVTRDRIRQIEAKALRKLRMPRRSHWMRYGKEARDRLNELQMVRNEELVRARVASLSQEINEALTNNDIQTLLNLKNKLAMHLAEYDVSTASGSSDPDVYDIPIEDLELSVRSYNCLRRKGCSTVGDICKMTEDELMRVRNLGRRSFDEVRTKIRQLGVDLKEGEDDT